MADPLTQLDVIDSAVKIGLGALISAVSSVVVLALTARNARKTEIRQRRLNAIEKSAVDFEKLTGVFRRLYAHYSLALGKIGKADEHSATSLTEDMDKVVTILDKEVGPALLECHRIEAVLTTVGCHSASMQVESYRIAATELQTACVHVANTEDPIPSHGDFKNLMVNVSRARVAVFAQIQKDFSGS